MGATYLLAVGLFCGQGRAADSVLGSMAAETIPIVDAHFHVMTWMDVTELVGYMNRNGIRWAGGVGIGTGQGAPGVGLPKHAEAISVLGSRYIRPTGQGPWLSLHRMLGATAFDDANSPAVKDRLSAVEGDLRDRGARAIGEIHVNALTTTPSTEARFKSRADSPVLKALFDLAGKYRRPLIIHAQWDSDTAKEVERLAESNHSAWLVLAHCGTLATPSQMRGVFERHPNVSCDLSYRGAPPLQGRSVSLAIFDDRGIQGSWKKLIEEYPDRFIVGVDITSSWEEYEKAVRAIRFGLLANLMPATAEKVAYRNAQVWFGLK